MISESTSPPMASLTVDVSAPSDHRWSGALPVQVRDVHKLVLTATGVSDRGLEVPAGRYLVTALLPNGQVATIDDIVELSPGEDRRVILSVPSLEAPLERTSTAAFVNARNAFARPSADFVSSHAFAIVKGNWLSAKTGSEAPSAITREPTTESRIAISYPESNTWVEIASKAGFTYLAIPVDENGCTVFQWGVNSNSGALDIKLDFRNGELNAFYDFIINDQAQGARAVGHSLVAQSEQYMADKRRSPLRAVLGAYVLLRANELEGMDVWTDNLVKWFAWLPDALAVRVEYLARRGNHAAASRLLLDAPARGVPWFRSGIGYLENRSRIYARVGAGSGKRSGLPLADDDLARIGRIAGTFGELIAALDMTQWSTVLRDVPRIG